MEIRVKLKNLRFGHDAGDINARRTGRYADIPALAANIFAQSRTPALADRNGLIENLTVKPIDGVLFAVGNGNRRLAALHMINNTDAYGSDCDEEIPCTPHEVDDAAAFEYSLTTAVTAAQLHPVDQYEAFARMVKAGRTNEEIAHQFGMSEKEVRQALALGDLSPRVRDAWRNGEIKVDVARAFTLGANHKAQDKLFIKLQKVGHLYEHVVKRELGASEHDIVALLSFVGAEAYVAAGGGLVEDLFGTSHIVSKPELLKQLATDKLALLCDELRAEGWSWVELSSDLPSGARWWQKAVLKTKLYEGDEEERIAALRKQINAADENMEIDDFDEDALIAQVDAIEAAVLRRSFTTQQKQKSGCIVEYANGSVDILFGVKKPEEPVKAKSGNSAAVGEAVAPAEPTEPAISNALLHRLSVQLTQGTATALLQDLELSTIVLLAGIADGSDPQVKVNVRGLGAATMDLLGGQDVAANIALLKQMDVQGRVQLMTSIAAATLDFQNCTLDGDRDSTAAAICDALDAKALNAALRGAFDAKDYFSGVSKGLALAAIGEALGPDIERQQSKGKRAEIAAFALANVPSTGWLPKQLRAKGYDGPPVKPAAPVAEEPAKSTARRPRSPRPVAKTAKKAVKKTAAKKPAAKKAAKKKAKR